MPQAIQTTETQPPSRSRSVSAILCLVLAALLTTPAAVAYWGQRTLNDTDRYLETVKPLSESPEVQEVIATSVTSAIEQQVDIEATLDEVFADVITDKPRLELLIGPLAAGVNGLIDREVRAFIASDEFEQIWLRLNTKSHQVLHRLLAGEDAGAVSLQGEQVVLDLDAVITEVKERLVDRGLSVLDRVPLPETDRQVVIADAPQVRQARTIYAFSNPVAIWLLPVVGLLYLAAFVLARRRPRMTVAIGALIAINTLVIALLLTVGRQLFINEVSTTQFAPASGVFFTTLFAFLERGRQVMFALGIFLVFAGWFSGQNRYGSGLRASVTGGLQRAGASMPEERIATAGRWVATNVVWLRAVVAALGATVLLWGNDVSMSRTWWTLALVLTGYALLEVLVGAGNGRRDVVTQDVVTAEPRSAS